MGAQWTPERNKLMVKTVRAILTVNYNYRDVSCSEFSRMINKEQKLLQEVQQKGKYVEVSSSESDNSCTND